MSKNGIISELKGIAYEMVDNNGKFRTVPLGTVGSRKLSNERIKLLQYLLNLVKDTSIVTSETKMYIFNRYITIKGVNEEMNRLMESKGKQYSYNTTASKIAYDRNKLQGLLGTDILKDILLGYNNDSVIKKHTENVINAYLKYSKAKGKDIRDGLALEISKSFICTELSEQKFEQFLVDISPFLKSHMRKVAEGLDKESVGYFNYLLYSPILTDEDKARLENLRQRLDPDYTVPVDLTDALDEGEEVEEVAGAADDNVGYVIE